MIENKTTEFKREYIDDIKYTVAPFANTESGKIYIKHYRLGWNLYQSRHIVV